MKRAALVLLTLSWGAAAQSQAEEPAPDYANMRAQGEAAIRERLIDPSSAEIEWPYGFVEGTWPTIFKNRTYDGYITCGFVNAKNRMGGYGGRTAFVVVIADGQVRYSDIGKPDGSGWTSRTCAKSAPEFPAPQQTMIASAVSPPTTVSIADELAKLAALRDGGVLSEEEFQSQKQKLLEN
jgi:hypothetical protein